MINDDQDAVDLLRQMGRLVVPLLTPEQEASRHEQMSRSVNRLLENLPRQRPRRRLAVPAVGAIAAVAAAAGLLFAGQRWLRAPIAHGGTEVARVISVSGESNLLRAGSPPSLLVAERGVAAADELVSASGSHAELALTGAGKARLEISEETRLRINQRTVSGNHLGNPNEDWLDLEQGLVTLQVSKLPPGLGFSVQTPDARVTVHGTRFSVRVTARPPLGTVTFVAVSEGRVAVDSHGRTVLLGPGERWSSETETTEQDEPRHASVGNAPPPVSGPEAKPAGTPDARSARPVAEVPSSSLRSSSSTLAEENRLYARALAQGGAGDFSAALSGLATLIQNYRGSPLAQSARVDRFRLLQRSGNGSAAAQEARRYLSDYPNGFARAEARRLALQGLEQPE